MSVDPTRAYAYVPERIEALRDMLVPGGSLTRAFYPSPEVHAADVGRISRRHWLYAAHACELAAPGALPSPDPGRFSNGRWADNQLNARAISAYAAYYALSSPDVAGPSGMVSS